MDTFQFWHIRNGIFFIIINFNEYVKQKERAACFNLNPGWGYYGAEITKIAEQLLAKECTPMWVLMFITTSILLPLNKSKDERFVPLKEVSPTIFKIE
jgi:hypothetical protein